MSSGAAVGGVPTPRYADVVARLGRAQKSPHAVPPYTRWINRPLGRRVAALAYLRGMTPDQVTAVSMVLSFAGMALMCLAPVSRPTGAAVGLLLAAGYVLDSADGQLARLTGTGGPAGEWLDHVSDQFRQGCLHVAVLVYLVRHLPEVGWPGYAVPLAFGVVTATRFMSQILGEQLRRAAGVRPAAPADDPGAARRAWLQLPSDFGVICVTFVLTGVPVLFFTVYTALLALNVPLALVSMIRRRRELIALRPA